MVKAKEEAREVIVLMVVVVKVEIMGIVSAPITVDAITQLKLVGIFKVN